MGNSKLITATAAITIFIFLLNSQILEIQTTASYFYNNHINKEVGHYCHNLFCLWLMNVIIDKVPQKD